MSLLQDTAVILGREQQRLTEEVSVIESQEERLQYIHGQIAACQTSASLDEMAQTYHSLLRTCKEEYILYNIAAAALSQVGKHSIWLILVT